jgi:hypothetical protein
MTLEALLAFIGILVAIVAVARPVQRRSLTLFVSTWWLSAAILLSFFLIICRDAPFGVRPPFGWTLPIVVFGLTIAAFVVPILAAICGGLSWYRAKLTNKRIQCVGELFQAALREGEFDEVERILRRNQQALERLPASASSVLFDPAMVAALVNSHSLIHLEMLANIAFFQSLENRLRAVDVVVRTLLTSGVSPIRSAVASKYGGLEHLTYPAAERDLMTRTFQNPEWYFLANAHYPLTISALEALRSGSLDTVYNDTCRGYEANQGISPRLQCPIYLATKTSVIAIEAALKQRIERDFYVTDLSDIFQAVQERSRFTCVAWRGLLANSEFPTPYSYLLFHIASDLRDLSAKARQKATSMNCPVQATAPGQIAQALAQTWSWCVWSIADSQQLVSAEFRNHIIEQYLMFVLALHGQPSEIYHCSVTGDVQGIQAWRDLFLGELRSRFGPSDPLQKGMLEDAFKHLDKGKSFVSQGSDWLEQELFGTP